MLTKLRSAQSHINKNKHKQLKNMQSLSKLTYLYLSFTKVMMSTVLDTFRNLNLEYLDACGIM